ncbi:MAG: DegT/DnrJ/EryC1/StrS family aminotransferase [Ardenticatenaceae bacterium]|nr:DegT/DnrJ/EryC1/StrS family aminotransferase [Ardenticatenaceae bacterium]
MIASARLAIDGGEPALKQPLPAKYPGALLIGEEERRAVLEVLEAQSPFRFYGPRAPGKVSQFERELARVAGVPYALGVSSGTAALKAALQAVGVGPGDEVIVPAVSFLACAGAVVASRAVPIFADVDDSLGLDPAALAARVTQHTKAVMPVAIQGVPYRADAIVAVAQAHGLAVIEDVAQSLGASYRGRPLGAWGDIAAFSLQLNKILTSGDGGAVATREAALYERAVRCHDQGLFRADNTFQVPVHGEPFLAENYRMNELSGAVALAQLHRLDGILTALRRNKELIKAAIPARRGLVWRDLPDEAGDAGVALMFYLPTPELAATSVRALTAENIVADRLYGGQPAYLAWPQITHRRTITSEGCPFACPLYGGHVEYGPGLCPRAEDLFPRAVRVPISPLFTAADCAAIAAGINKVADHLLETE